MRAPADGYTLYWVTPGQVTILPAVARPSYDPVKSLLPVTVVAENRFALVVNPKSLPVSTITELIDLVRAQPGKFTYASPGPGSIGHLAMELFSHRLKLEMVGVTYKGIAPAFADVIAGHVPMMFASLGDAIEQSKRGTIRLLAVSTRERATRIPDVPTMSESGAPGFHIVSWNGLMAPSGTPKAIVERIAAEVGRATKTAAFAERLTGLGFEPIGNRPEEFAATDEETLESIKPAARPPPGRRQIPRRLPNHSAGRLHILGRRAGAPEID
jgi:tripartite-type tricarboxylate transporter receptor subunit TctC